MISFFMGLNTIIQSLFAGIFTFLITSLGAFVVFFFKKEKYYLLDIMLSISAGIMLSASFFSLINPALNLSKILKLNPIFVVTIGFIIGTIFILSGDIIFSKYKKSTSFKRSFMLFFSITLHNIPEGLSIGVAFGSTRVGLPGATIASALLLTLGIGIQNFPEGTSISLPLHREGISKRKAFMLGVLSASVEPVSAIIGAIMVLKVKLILPYLLSFASSAMIYVVIKELIPESQKNNHQNVMTLFTMIGFVIMMILDVALG